MPIMKFFKNSFFTPSTNHCCSIAKSCPNLCDPIGLQQVRLPCPSPSTSICSISCPSNLWSIQPSYPLSPSSPLVLSLSRHQSFPMSGLLTSGGQNIGASGSASVLPMNIQGWFLLGLTGLISLQSKGLSRVFSTTTWKYQLSALFLWSASHIHTWLPVKP